MHPPKVKKGKYVLGLLHHPLPKVLKFEMILEYFKKIGKKTILLDYGSGSQLYRNFFESVTEQYISADYAPTNLIHGIKPDIYIDDEQRVELEDNSIDVVCLLEVLEHISKPGKALAEIHRVLKIGGYVIGSSPFVQNEHEIPYDFNRFTYFGLKNLFANNGFEILKLEHIGGVFGVIIVMSSKYSEFVYKVLNKIHLKFFSYILSLWFKIPEFVYLFFFRRKYFGVKLNRFSSIPLGYTFLVKKI